MEECSEGAVAVDEEYKNEPVVSLYLCVYIRSCAVAFSLHLVFGTHNLIIFFVFWLVAGICLSFVGR